MPSKRESSDAARQGRTYRSTASAKQVRFPIRRSRVRGQGNGVQKRERASLKQQTLTQMAFVSSFSDEALLMDDDDDEDASDGTPCGDDKPAAPQRSSKAESEDQPREPIRRSLKGSMRGSVRGVSPVIQDSYGSLDNSFPNDELVEASPPQLLPIQGRDTAVSPRRRGGIEPFDAVKASPRRRAHWIRNLEGPKAPAQSFRANDTSPSVKYADDMEIPDSDEESEDLELQVDGPVLLQHDTFATGHETQLALEELASLEYSQLDGQPMVNDQLPSSTPRPSALASSGIAAVRKLTLPPIEVAECLPTPAETASQPPSTPLFPRTTPRSQAQAESNQSQVCQDQAFESQRVPLHVLQSFTPVSARTDILLPTRLNVVKSIVDGSETTLRLIYRVPEQVRRFWLFDHETLRYMACVQPGTPRGFLDWEYSVDQVYELNNPVEERDMQEEGWVTGQVRRYIYLPPAIVGQLLWNLRCATFARGGLRSEDDNHENGDRESSNNAETRDSRSPNSLDNNHGVHLPVPSSQQATYPENYTSPPDADPPSSLFFEDHGSSTTPFPANDVAALVSSPLLTKSQMLSDSLISDDLP